MNVTQIVIALHGNFLFLLKVIERSKKRLFPLIVRRGITIEKQLKKEHKPKIKQRTLNAITLQGAIEKSSKLIS